VTVSRFDRLYRDNFPFVWAAARRCGAPDEAVGDVVQDVFITAHRRLHELSYEVSPRGWLYGVTRRVAFRYRRSAARTARRKAAVAVRTAKLDRPHARHDAARELEMLLEQLDDDQRRAFVMAELLGMTGPEIAGELGVPLPTVYSRLRLARRRLEHVARTPDALDASLDAARRTHAPPDGQAQRTWAALVPVLGSPVVPVKLAIASIAKSMWLPVAAVVAIAVGVASTRADDPETAPTQGAVDLDSPRSLNATAQAEALSQPPPPDAPIAVTSHAPQLVPAARPALSPAPRSRSEPSPSNPSADALVLEVELLESARRALRGDDPERALSLLHDLDRRMANGQLLDARKAARVRALCAAGRTTEAEREAAALHRDHPGSNVALGTPKKCAAS
jgi:RNA polymerase sigma factor (sigma-70 family)